MVNQLEQVFPEKYFKAREKAWESEWVEAL